METIIQSDIFFFVTTIAVAVVSILTTIVIVKVLSLVSMLKRMAVRAEETAEKATALYYIIRKFIKIFI